MPHKNNRDQDEGNPRVGSQRRWKGLGSHLQLPAAPAVNGRDRLTPQGLPSKVGGGPEEFNISDTKER